MDVATILAMAFLAVMLAAVIRAFGARFIAACAMVVALGPMIAAIIDLQHIRQALRADADLLLYVADLWETPVLAALTATARDARLRGRLETALRGPQPPQAIRSAIDGAVAEEIPMVFREALPSASEGSLLALTAVYARVAQANIGAAPANDCLTPQGPSADLQDEVDAAIASVIATAGSAPPRAPAPMLFRQLAGAALAAEGSRSMEPCASISVVLRAIPSAPANRRAQIALAALL